MEHIHFVPFIDDEFLDNFGLHNEGINEYQV